MNIYTNYLCIFFYQQNIFFSIQCGFMWFTNHGNKIWSHDLLLIHWGIGHGAGSSKVQDFIIFINNLAFDYHKSDELLVASELVDQMFPSATEELYYINLLIKSHQAPVIIQSLYLNLNNRFYFIMFLFFHWF